MTHVNKNIVNIPLVYNGLSKAAISDMAAECVNRCVENGRSLEMAEAIACAEFLIAEIKANTSLKESVRADINIQGEKNKYLSPGGARIEAIEAGTKYNFDNTGDFILPSLRENLDKAKAAVKEREDFLKTLPVSGMELLNKETGEMVMVYPPSKESTSSYKVTLAK